MSKGKDAKPHIGIFGRRNYGKSSLINTLANQDIAIVSNIAGTTTDPVRKSMEIAELGPVILVDTAGIDDDSVLGTERIKRSLQQISQIDLAILVIVNYLFASYEEDLVELFRKQEVPYLIVQNKTDLFPIDKDKANALSARLQVPIIHFSCNHPQNVSMLHQELNKLMPRNALHFTSIIGDLIKKDDVVLLVTPIDSEAPVGRMILPQVQLIRDVLDNHAVVVTLRETELEAYLKVMHPKPVLVITDSQAFEFVNSIVPPEIPLTGFSVVLARQKGEFEAYLKGTPKLAELKDGDRVLTLESCTHHVSCDDIGQIKIPKWIDKFTGKKLVYEMVSGLEQIKRPITEYAIVIQCGGCVITQKQVKNRLRPAIEAGVPVTNYGLAIAFLHGIFERATAPFKSKDL
ncbi:MAG: [FeFe] hydrogenase H-cluster maturation GTPase HydF [Bacteroidales bacterium]|nr:[FeFe] hydrogenase H-cluster maturation GTPase HydF [Bacteroidales bacterium]